MNWLTSRCVPLPLLAVAALALAGCDKGTDLNVDLPDTAAISTEYKDLPLEVAAVRLAPVQTLKTDRFLVGRLTDNIAGDTETKAFFNLVPGGSPTDTLPSTLPRARLDSAVLVMGFDKVYGSAATPVRFDVFALPQPLDDRQVYDGGSNTAVGAPLGLNLASRLDRTRVTSFSAVAATATTPATPAYTATVPDPTVRLLVQRRAFAPTPIRPAIVGLAQPVVEQLFNKTTQAGFDQTALDGIIKGLAVAPSAGHSSSILSFGRAYDARLVLYYHAADTLRRTFAVYFGPVYSRRGSATASDPRYYTQIASALPPVLAPLAAASGAVAPALLGGASYLQEGVGLGTRVKFLGLEELVNRPGLTINRAELQVPVKPFSNALFGNPPQIFAVEVDAGNGVLTRTLNYQPYDRVAQADGATPLGVNFPATGSLVDAGSTRPFYRFLITSYLQAYLTDKLEGNPAALVLVPNIRTGSTLTLNRAVLDATNIRLRVYYSKR